MPNPAIQFNLPFDTGISDSIPSTIPPEIRGVVEQLYATIKQLHLVLHSYVGIGQQLQSLWSQLPYYQTLHLASPWRYYRKASEIVAYGAAVNIFLDGGELKFRNANATNNTKPCHGFCTTVGGIAAGAYGEAVLMQGLLSAFVGLTVGARYFLSTANGLITAVAPVAAGNIEQALGIAVDSTALLYCTDFDFLQH